VGIHNKLCQNSYWKIILSENKALSWILLRDSVIQKEVLTVFLRLQRNYFLCNRLTMRYETVLENMYFLLSTTLERILPVGNDG